MKPLPELTPDQRAKIIRMIGGGNFFTAAAYGAGITPGQLQRVLQDGIRNPEGTNGAFARKALIAKAGAELGVLRKLLKLKKPRGSPEAWLSDRRYRHGRFSPWKLDTRIKELETEIRRLGGDPDETDEAKKEVTRRP
jgi:hypothetical protein